MAEVVAKLVDLRAKNKKNSNFVTFLSTQDGRAQGAGRDAQTHVPVPAQNPTARPRVEQKLVNEFMRASLQDPPQPPIKTNPNDESKRRIKNAKRISIQAESARSLLGAVPGGLWGPGTAKTRRTLPDGAYTHTHTPKWIPKVKNSGGRHVPTAGPTAGPTTRPTRAGAEADDKTTLGCPACHRPLDMLRIMSGSVVPLGPCQTLPCQGLTRSGTRTLLAAHYGDLICVASQALPLRG